MPKTEDQVQNDTVRARILAICLAQSHRVAEVCALMEVLADDLPRREAAVWRETRRQCRKVLQPHYQFLAREMLPTLSTSVKESSGEAELLTRLHSDVDNQTEALLELDNFFADAQTADRFRQQPEALGYALRGFFEQIRRSVDWEIGVLWPLASRVLSDEDVIRLQRVLQDRQVPQ